MSNDELVGVRTQIGWYVQVVFHTPMFGSKLSNKKSSGDHVKATPCHSYKPDIFLVTFFSDLAGNHIF